MQLTKRLFLKGNIAVAVAAIIGNTNTIARTTDEVKNWSGEYDVVIIGAGAAGLAGAIEAIQLGLSAVVVEKMPFSGGSSALCGGSFTVPDTAFQQKEGIKDSEEKFIEDMLKVGKYKNDPELLKSYVPAAQKHLKFITEERGIKPIEIAVFAGMSVPRAHNFKPSEVMMDMTKYVSEHGVKIMYNTAAKRLVWRDKERAVVGIECIGRNNEKIFIAAKKGVLIASGGFARNKTLLEKYNPLMSKVDPEGGMGNTGDGLLMAQEYGADTRDMAYIKATQGYRPTEPQFTTTFHGYYGGGVLVDKKGRRFTNEEQSYKLLADESLKLENGISYLVFDEPIRQSRMKARAVEKAYLSQMDGGKKVPWCFQASTLEKVAEFAGIDSKGLSETIKKYNEDIESTGKDSVFGRTELSAGYGKAVPIKTGPFYIYPVKPRLIATYCGLRINNKGRVINVFGEPIPHLYAAGEVTGGVHGAAYMSGTAWGKAMAYGRIAVENMAKQ